MKKFNVIIATNYPSNYFNKIKKALLAEEKTGVIVISNLDHTFDVWFSQEYQKTYLQLKYSDSIIVK